MGKPEVKKKRCRNYESVAKSLLVPPLISDNRPSFASMMSWTLMNPKSESRCRKIWIETKKAVPLIRHF